MKVKVDSRDGLKMQVHKETFDYQVGDVIIVDLCEFGGLTHASELIEATIKLLPGTMTVERAKLQQIMNKINKAIQGHAHNLPTT